MKEANYSIRSAVLNADTARMPWGEDSLSKIESATDSIRSAIALCRSVQVAILDQAAATEREHAMIEAFSAAGVFVKRESQGGEGEGGAGLLEEIDGILLGNDVAGTGSDGDGAGDADGGGEREGEGAAGNVSPRATALGVIQTLMWQLGEERRNTYETFERMRWRVARGAAGWPAHEAGLAAAAGGILGGAAAAAAASADAGGTAAGSDTAAVTGGGGCAAAATAGSPVVAGGLSNMAAVSGGGGCTADGTAGRAGQAEGVVETSEQGRGMQGEGSYKGGCKSKGSQDSISRSRETPFNLARESTDTRKNISGTPVEVLCPPLEALCLQNFHFTTTPQPTWLPPHLPSASPPMCFTSSSLPSSSSSAFPFPSPSAQPQTFESIALAAVFGRLKELTLLSCSGLEEEQILLLLRACSLLESLTMEYNNCFSDRMVARSRLESLTRLSMVGCGAITSAAIGDLLGSFPRLRRLNVEASKVAAKDRSELLRAGVILEGGNVYGSQ